MPFALTYSKYFEQAERGKLKIHKANSPLYRSVLHIMLSSEKPTQGQLILTTSVSFQQPVKSLLAPHWLSQSSRIVPLSTQMTSFNEIRVDPMPLKMCRYQYFSYKPCRLTKGSFPFSERKIDRTQPSLHNKSQTCTILKSSLSLVQLRIGFIGFPQVLRESPFKGWTHHADPKNTFPPTMLTLPKRKTQLTQGISPCEIPLVGWLNHSVETLALQRVGSENTQVQVPSPPLKIWVILGRGTNFTESLFLRLENKR